MRGHRLVAWSVALAVIMALTSCATLPTSGTLRLSTLQGSAGQAQQGIVIVPVPPGAGWDATDIVDGFLAASASFEGMHAVAREYLTRSFSRTWRPGWAATIIYSPTASLAKTPRGVNQQAGGRPSVLVNLTGSRFAKLETAGQDQAGSVVVSPGSSGYQFSLVRTADGWRIDAIYHDQNPVRPTMLLLTSTDFARDYLPRNLYFYRAGTTANVLVPDPVYMPQTGPVFEVQGLVNALIHPPTSSWLWGAVMTAFPPGSKLIRSPQITGGITAEVYVGGAAARASLVRQRWMAAELYWTLTHSPYATQYASPVKSVVLHVGHRSLQPAPGSVATWVPGGTQGALYYQAYGAQQPTVAALLAGSSAPVLLPLPTRPASSAWTAMAVFSPQHVQPVIAGCAGRNLYLVKLNSTVTDAKKPSAGGTLTTVRKRLPADCSSLSWDNSGNLWITANSHLPLMLRTAGMTALADLSLVSVQVPQLSPAKPPPITALKVAPDGVRVAMIVGTGQSKRILLAAISRTNSFTLIGATQLLRVGSDIANPVALTWLDPDHLLVLSRSGSGRTLLFEVPLNGGQSTEITIPRGVTSVAASWMGGQTYRVVIGIRSTVNSAGKIEMATNGLPSPQWAPVALGTSPVYPG